MQHSTRTDRLATDTPQQAKLHAGQHDKRRRIIAALVSSAEAAGKGFPHEDHRHNKLARKLCNCGKHPAIMQEVASGELIAARARCKARICPTCGIIRAKTAARRVRQAVKEGDDLRFLTLTPLHSDRPLREQMAHLTDSVRRLRRRKAWKSHVRGGIVTYEIKWNAERQEWHPHAHMIIDGIYWKQKAISEEWKAASGGAYIVDIRRIASREAITRYITKYISKAQDPSNFPAPRLAEWADSLHGLRLMQTFGTMHGKDADPAKPAEPSTFEHVVYVGALQSAAEEGDTRARRLIRLVDRLVGRGLPDGDPDEAQRRLRRHQSTARRLRNWWRRVQETHGVYRPPPRRAHAVAHRADHGALRLWEESELAGDSVFDGYDG